MHKSIIVFFLMACGLAGTLAAQGRAGDPTDVIARVGDQAITFGQINTMLNSSAIVGLSLPALGTPERDTARILVLDKVISANLLYLDALRQGLDKDPTYRRGVKRFADGILSGLYIQRNLSGDISVTDEEVQTFYSKSMATGVELTDDVRAGIEATLRKRKLKEHMAAQRKQLREGVDVVVYENNIALAGDAARGGSVPVARVGGETVTWGEVKSTVVAVGKGATKRNPLAMEDDVRLRALQSEIDTRILAQKARAAGLEDDPRYQARLKEYRKTRLINLHRANLAREMAPSEQALKAYYEQNRGRLAAPEVRKVQMVVLDSEEQAETVKARLEAGEMTMFQAASSHSIAPEAKQNLGEIGWVTQGTAPPALDKAIFSLGPAEIGGPVKSPAGWHLVMVQDVREAQHDSFDDPATRKLARRTYIHEKLDEYAVNLRKNVFPVEVYEDVIVRLAQQEADMVGRLAEKAKGPSSVTRQRIQEYQELMKR